MANVYPHDSVLSKVKIGNNTYYFKDADLRGIVDQYGNVVSKDVATSITETAAGVTTGAQVYEYVQNAISGLEGAMHFRGVYNELPDPALGDFKNGDVIIVGTKEYVLAHDSSQCEDVPLEEDWKELGDEGRWVPKSRTIAGLSLENNISKSQLQTALELAALAYKASASTTVTDYATGITGASYTPAGSVTIGSTQETAEATLTTASYTPAGSVTITAGTAAAASYDKTTSVTVAAATPSGSQEANYTPSGTVTVTSVTVTPTTGTASHVTDAGTGYTLSDGSVTKGADTKSAFATAGVIASIDSTDSEMLVFTNASTSDAVTASGAITYNKQVLSGALPTFENVSVATGIQGASASASFDGDGALITASPNYSTTSATVTQPTFSGSFSGTAEADLKVTKVEYTETTVGTASFSGTAATITPTLDKGNKIITVS